jgi:hypothetical protein
MATRQMRPTACAATLQNTVRDDVSSRLPQGYSLDLADDPCVIILRRPDGTVVARFTHVADPKEIRLAAEEDAGVQSRTHNG